MNISLIDIPEVIPGDGRIYVQFRSINYQSPIVLGQSKAAYVSGVYALDENGSLLWNRTVSATAYDMNVVNNSTILYRNGDGKLVLTNSGRSHRLRPHGDPVYFHQVHLRGRGRARAQPHQ